MTQNAGLSVPDPPGRPIEDSRPPIPLPATQAPAPSAPGSRAGMRASDQDRDAVVGKLQRAFAEGRIDDEEFDGRVRAVLVSRTFGELEQWTADLPEAPASQLSAALPVKAAGKPARLSLAYKTRLRRGGRWRVPAKFRAVAYKGGSVIDLRVADLVEGHTTIRAIAYKCTVTVLVAPGMRFELSGIGVDEADDGGLGSQVGGAPVVRIKGIAYKGRVEVRTLPEQPNQLEQ